ncbi:MAG TPA: hypothetical protein PK635_15405, partial [Actinomycetota bacterium]|nr:hypothetical protein [Actinomycetota bacterium]
MHCAASNDASPASSSNSSPPTTTTVKRLPSRQRLEVKEETGFDVEVETITGTYTNPHHVMAYDDGELRQQFSIALRARLIGGEKRTSAGSSEVEWLTPDEVSRLNLHPSMRLRLAH